MWFGLYSELVDAMKAKGHQFTEDDWEHLHILDVDTLRVLIDEWRS